MATKGMSILTVLIASCSLASGFGVKVLNNVAPCSNGQYSATIKLFYGNSQQIDVNRGDSFSLDSSQIPPTGLGIQENGEYCCFCGPESGCSNLIMGMQLVFNSDKDCSSYQVNAPFYCGVHPPMPRLLFLLRFMALHMCRQSHKMVQCTFSPVLLLRDRNRKGSRVLQ